MSAALDPEVFFQAAGVGLLLHLTCSVLLRSRIGPSDALIGELFASPVLGDLTATPWLLRGKYFLPWVGAPGDLKSYSPLPKVLFWGARVGAMLLIGGFAAFFLTLFWRVWQA